MRSLGLAVGLALIHGIAGAQAIQRCEDAAGRPAYTNTDCPAGTRVTRTLDASPPVQDAERKAAQARAKQEAERIKAIDQEAAAEQNRARTAQEKEHRAQANQASRCERARHDLARAQNTRAELGHRAVKVESMQKADRAVAQAESRLSRDCSAP
ncbi:MAG: hypothetical protein RR101_08890 [Burkholderiaceae bacterium]